jgi:large subunit ribosomal protein L19e
MKLTSQRRLAGKIFNTGIRRVWFDPFRLADISEAITRQDIAELIKDGAIKVLPVKGRKRRSGKERERRYAKGRKRGTGRIKKAMKDRKGDYMRRIRKIRNYLKRLKQDKKIGKKEYGKIRRLAKAGMITNIEKVNEHIQNKQK